MEKDYYHLRFLQSRDVDPDEAWILIGNQYLSELSWVYRYRMDYDNDIINLKEPDFDEIPLLPASSWSDCASAGLVERGWFKDGSHKSGQFWGLRLTPHGRKRLKAESPDYLDRGAEALSDWD